MGPVSDVEARVEVAVREALGRPVTSWDVRDVCNWVQAIGFPQYRTKFAHNSVKGDLLLRLTDDELARQLGILPLGHRQALRDKIDELKAWVPPEGYGQQASSPRHSPAPPDLLLPEPFLGPAQGKMRAEEQRDRLRYEMDRARTKAAQASIVLEQVARVKALADEENLRLRGQLQVVDQKAQQRSR
ncbi:SAM domain-containing protein, partial [Haematococcus lacustris]